MTRPKVSESFCNSTMSSMGFRILFLEDVDERWKSSTFRCLWALHVPKSCLLSRWILQLGHSKTGSSQAQPPAIIASAARGAFVLHPLGRCLATTTGAGRFGGRQGDFGRFEGKLENCPKAIFFLVKQQFSGKWFPQKALFISSQFGQLSLFSFASCLFVSEGHFDVWPEFWKNCIWARSMSLSKDVRQICTSLNGSAALSGRRWWWRWLKTCLLCFICVKYWEIDICIYLAMALIKFTATGLLGLRCSGMKADDLWIISLTLWSFCFC